jgi:probable addiction module antidote protein
MPLETTLYDSADYLDTPEAQAAYLASYFEDGTPEEIAEAFATVARARKMTAPAGGNLPQAVRALGFKLVVVPA